MDWDKLVMNNSHWEGGFTYQYPIEREVVKELKQGMERSRMIKLILGPRRVGKTVIMKQMINYLIKRGVERKKILYILLDGKDVDLWKIITSWKRELGINLNEKTYVFLDEIQYIEGWGHQVKFLYDTFPRMHIVLSGSASALIRKGSESLAGRLVERYVGPLSFEEYLKFSNRYLPSSETEVWKLYWEYMFKQLPEIAMGEDRIEYVRSIVNKIVREDVRELFGTPDVELGESLIRIVFKRPGQIIDYVDLSNELGVDRNTLSKYINAFCNAFVFRKVYNYSNNPRKTEKRKKKFYPFYTTLVNYIHPFIPEEGLLLETEVFEKLNAEYYYRERDKEIDVILPRCKYGIEVKTGKRITRTQIRTLLNTPWLKKKIVVCPPTTECSIQGVIRVSPNMLNRVQQVCNKHAE